MLIQPGDQTVILGDHAHRTNHSCHHHHTDDDEGDQLVLEGTQSEKRGKREKRKNAGSARIFSPRVSWFSPLVSLRVLPLDVFLPAIRVRSPTCPSFSFLRGLIHRQAESNSPRRAGCGSWGHREHQSFYEGKKYRFRRRWLSPRSRNPTLAPESVLWRGRGGGSP